MRGSNRISSWPGAAALLGAALGVWICTTNAASSEVYIVRKNDSLSQIAQTHGVRVQELARVNGLSLESTIYPGQRLQIPLPARDQERHDARTVTVRKNDSLTLIARRHRVSVAAPARANGLSLDDLIRPGDKLRLPTAAPARPALETRVQKAIDIAPVRRGMWKQIVIHHTATTMATIRGMDEYHRMECRMENGLAYHFVIGNGQGIPDGRIEVGNRWTRQLEGGHLSTRSQNLVSLGVCLVGHFDRHRPTPKQLESLDALLRALMKRCGLGPSAITTHQLVSKQRTRCPGKFFDLKLVLAELRKD